VNAVPERGIKNRLNADALQIAQLTPPSWRVGAAHGPQAKLRPFWHFLATERFITTQNSNKMSSNLFSFPLTHFLQKFCSRS
jgi:hypothetical protein